MTFYIYAWLSSIGFGIETLIGKFTGKYEIKNPWLFNFMWTLIFSIFTILIALTQTTALPTHYSNLLIASLFSAVAGIFVIMSIQKLDVSVFSPLFNFKTLFSVFFGYLFLGEVLTPNQYIYIFLIIVAGMFVSMDEKLNIKSFFTKNIFIGLVLMILLSFMSIYLNKSIVENGFWVNSLWFNILTLFFTIFTFPMFYKDLKISPIKNYTGVLLMSLMGIWASLASQKAYEQNVGISSAIISLPISMILVFLIGLFKPGLLEKHSLKTYAVRFTAAFVMFFSALNL